MGSHVTRTEPNTLLYRYANSEVFDTKTVARSTSRLPNPVFSQSPLQFSSQHIVVPPESGSVLGTSTTGFTNLEQEAHSSREDITCRGDCCYSRELHPSKRPSARGCDAPTLKYPLDLPSTPSQPSVTSPKSTTGPLSHGTPAHPVIFTDDAKTKLGDRVRRQCFNCRITTTKAWRRSVLSPGKMVCNKCGLFERTHAVPRPKSFPLARRHHLRSTAVYTGTSRDHPLDHVEYCHHNDRLSVPLLTTDSHFPNAFGHTGVETSSQSTTWVDRCALPPTSNLSPTHSISPQSSSTPRHTGPSIICRTCRSGMAPLPSRCFSQPT